MAILVEARSIGFKHDGGPWLFKDLSFALAPGSALAVMGRSGCGKSTLLRILGGLLNPSEGEVRWAAPELTVLPSDRRESQGQPLRRAAMMFQAPRLLPWRTALGNVAFGLEHRSAPRKLVEGRARAALERVGLADLMTRYPSQLSGGQQQRVALARALATGARVLLLDEPFSALDRETHAQLLATLRELLHGGISIVLVSHDPADCSALEAEPVDLEGGAKPGGRKRSGIIA